MKMGRILVEINPSRNYDYMRDLGVSYLIGGINDAAEEIFQKVVNLDPSDGFAQVHLAFAKKMIADKSKKDEDYESCLEPFKIGVERE